MLWLQSIFSLFSHGTLHFCLTSFSYSCFSSITHTFLYLPHVSPSLPRFSSKPLSHSSTFYVPPVRSTYPKGLPSSEFRWRIFPPLYSPSFYSDAERGFRWGVFFWSHALEMWRKGHLPLLRSGICHQCNPFGEFSKNNDATMSTQTRRCFVCSSFRVGVIEWREREMEIARRIIFYNLKCSFGQEGVQLCVPCIKHTCLLVYLNGVLTHTYSHLYLFAEKRVGGWYEAIHTEGHGFCSFIQSSHLDQKKEKKEKITVFC